MINIILSGCNGYMGRVVTDIAADDPSITIVAGIDVVTTRSGSFPVYAGPA